MLIKKRRIITFQIKNTASQFYHKLSGKKNFSSDLKDKSHSWIKRMGSHILKLQRISP